MTVQDRAVPIIRVAHGGDVIAMLDVWREAGFLHNPASRRRELDCALSLAPDLLLVAEVDGAMAGVVLGTTDGHRGYLKRLVVVPAHRRRGVGRALVAEIERRFAARGLYRLNLAVRADDSTAAAFWRAIGYELEPAVITWVKSLPD